MNEKLKFYLNQLFPKRAAIYSKSWWSVGSIIYSITKGSEEGYNLWHKFSQQYVRKYNKKFCDVKWDTFKKSVYSSSIQTLISYVYEDGGTIYNPDHRNMVENEEVKNFVYDVLLPKLSIRRMRNRKTLNNLCSALYHMSSGKDRGVLDDVCKRIKDVKLKTYFVSCWDRTYFLSSSYDINNIINWVNHDEKEKPKPKPCTITNYISLDLKWVEKTKSQLKFLDDNGYKPYYLKGHLGKRVKRLS